MLFGGQTNVLPFIIADGSHNEQGKSEEAIPSLTCGFPFPRTMIKWLH